ncbi:MAG: hypothetical protein E6K70_17440, partial [Planctomycetota bacterium]
AAHLQNDVVSIKAQVDQLQRGRERLRQRSEQAAGHLASLDVELQELTQADEALQARLAGARQTLAAERQERERLQSLADQTNQLRADLRAERSGVASRMHVLEGLEKSHEGLDTGVREVFALMEQADPGPWRAVLGIIADFLTVRREYAPLIDLALGDRAQRFLVRDAGLLQQALRERPQPFSGRVSFLPLNLTAPENGQARTNRLLELSRRSRMRMPLSPEGVPAHTGIVALAEHLVACEHPELGDLPAQLLGQTLIVRDLDTARAIAGHTSGHRFVTLQGEVLDPDGTVTVGTHHAEAGILSRKSELRELREKMVELERRLAETERDLGDLRERVAGLDRQAVTLQESIDVLAEQAADLRWRLGQHRQRRDGLHEEVTLSRSEISGVEKEIENLEHSWRQASAQAQEAEQQVRLLQARLEKADEEISERERQRQLHQQRCTAAKVGLAQVAERLAALRAKHRQIETDLQQRRQERVQGERQLQDSRARMAESQRSMLQASAAQATWYQNKEARERRLVELNQDRELKRQERHVLGEQAQAARTTWQAQQEQAHARELEVNDLRHRRATLVERMREDYQLDLAELFRSRPAQATRDGSRQPLNAEQVQEEIAELRRKLSRLGSVNLDSLQELAELENRAGNLKAQANDLAAAKQALQEIIGKINQDSRRLFAESFAAIRTHFQELFRKLFGGGMADVVLEDETDILESGVEIIARPPGKELRSISLMSGGEKTLTAVALLLAIFRSKPSPFCILDEVDAALDEANIGRFTTVLRDFLDRSHFIIITHSKRTMTVADVLYGVTMQESGISKRVAVRFEDWPEDALPQNGQAVDLAVGSDTTVG